MEFQHISRDVCRALEDDNDLAWVGKIPQNYVASTIEALRHEKQLLVEAKHRLDPRDPFKHSEVVQIIEKYKLLKSNSPLESADVDKILHTLALQYAKAELRLSRGARLMQGAIPLKSLPIDFKDPENLKKYESVLLAAQPSQKIQNLQYLISVIANKEPLSPEFFDRASVYFPNLVLDRTQVDLTTLLVGITDAIRREEEVKDIEILRKYTSIVEKDAQELEPSAKQAILQEKQNELQNYESQRKIALDQIRELEIEKEHLENIEDLSLSQEVANVLQQKKFETNLNANAKFDHLIDEMNLPPPEEVEFRRSRHPPSPTDELHAVTKIVEDLRKQIRSLTENINILRIQCDVLRSHK